MLIEEQYGTSCSEKSDKNSQAAPAKNPPPPNLIRRVSRIMPIRQSPMKLLKAANKNKTTNTQTKSQILLLNDVDCM